MYLLNVGDHQMPGDGD